MTEQITWHSGCQLVFIRSKFKSEFKVNYDRKLSLSLINPTYLVVMHYFVVRFIFNNLLIYVKLN